MTNDTWSRKRGGALRTATVLLGAVALAITGCTADADPRPSESSSAEILIGSSASPTPASVALPDGEVISGVGMSIEWPGVPFPIPEGAQSIILDVECSSDFGVGVTLVDGTRVEERSLSGDCGSDQPLIFPVISPTEHTIVVYTVEGEEWSVRPHFSTEPFVSDEAITADCAAFAPIYSALSNADIGFSPHHRAIDEAEWTRRVDGAAVSLSALAESSTSSLAGVFAQLHAAVTDPARLVGDLTNSSAELTSQVFRACSTNHTTFDISAEFGG